MHMPYSMYNICNQKFTIAVRNRYSIVAELFQHLRYARSI